ncbi:MAG: hypothetical protein PVH87_24260 [Desulfobacteraceae bacterium]
MSEPTNDKLIVQVNVEITAVALQSIVANAKLTAPKDANGNYHVDTADYVSAMISRFLAERDFDSFVMDADNYPSG